MNKIPKQITIIPASSRTGKACITSLCEQGYATSITACVIEDEPFEAGVRVLYGINAGDTIALRAAFFGSDIALIVTPHDSLKGVESFQYDAALTMNMINEAVNAGVKFICLVGSWAVHQPRIFDLMAQRYLAPEALLRKLEVEKGLEWTVLRGGFFLSNFDRLLNHFSKRGENVGMIQQYLAPIHTKDIGMCASRVLQDGPLKHHGKCYEMNGPKLLSSSDIHRALQNAIGRTISLRIIKASDMVGAHSGFHHYFESNGEKALPFTSDVEQLIGRNCQTTVEQYFRDVISEIRATTHYNTSQ